MCDESDLIYKPGDIVWIKLPSVWWPAEVQDQDEWEIVVPKGLKKRPLVIVKFFNQSNIYVFVRNLDQIYYYNCPKKNDFIKQGLEKSSQGERFQPDVVEAQMRTGGNPDVLTEFIFQPEQKPELGNSNLFAIPKYKAKKRLAEDGRPPSKASLPTPSLSPQVKIFNDMIPAALSRRQASNDHSSLYSCDCCPFTAPRLTMISDHCKTCKPSAEIASLEGQDSPLNKKNVPHHSSQGARLIAAVKISEKSAVEIDSANASSISTIPLNDERPSEGSLIVIDRFDSLNVGEPSMSEKTNDESSASDKNLDSSNVVQLEKDLIIENPNDCGGSEVVIDGAEAAAEKNLPKPEPQVQATPTFDHMGMDFDINSMPTVYGDEFVSDLNDASAVSTPRSQPEAPTENIFKLPPSTAFRPHNRPGPLREISHRHQRHPHHRHHSFSHHGSRHSVSRSSLPSSSTRNEPSVNRTMASSKGAAPGKLFIVPNATSTVSGQRSVTTTPPSPSSRMVSIKGQLPHLEKQSSNVALPALLKSQTNPGPSTVPDKDSAYVDIDLDEIPIPDLPPSSNLAVDKLSREYDGFKQLEPTANVTVESPSFPLEEMKKVVDSKEEDAGVILKEVIIESRKKANEVGMKVVESKQKGVVQFKGEVVVESKEEVVEGNEEIVFQSKEEMVVEDMEEIVVEDKEDKWIYEEVVYEDNTYENLIIENPNDWGGSEVVIDDAVAAADKNLPKPELPVQATPNFDPIGMDFDINSMPVVFGDEFLSDLNDASAVSAPMSQPEAPTVVPVNFDHRGSSASPDAISVEKPKKRRQEVRDVIVILNKTGEIAGNSFELPPSTAFRPDDRPSPLRESSHRHHDHSSLLLGGPHSVSQSSLPSSSFRNEPSVGRAMSSSKGVPPGKLFIVPKVTSTCSGQRWVTTTPPSPSSRLVSIKGQLPPLEKQSSNFAFPALLKSQSNPGPSTIPQSSIKNSSLKVPSFAPKVISKPKPSGPTMQLIASKQGGQLKMVLMSANKPVTLGNLVMNPSTTSSNQNLDKMLFVPLSHSSSALSNLIKPTPNTAQNSAPVKKAVPIQSIMRKKVTMSTQVVHQKHSSASITRQLQRAISESLSTEPHNNLSIVQGSAGTNDQILYLAMDDQNSPILTIDSSSQQTSLQSANTNQTNNVIILNNPCAVGPQSTAVTVSQGGDSKALANTQVLQSDISDVQSLENAPVYIVEQFPIASLSHNVLETSLALNQPIMTPIEQPSIAQSTNSNSTSQVPILTESDLSESAMYNTTTPSGNQHPVAYQVMTSSSSNVVSSDKTQFIITAPSAAGGDPSTLVLGNLQGSYSICNVQTK